MQDDPMTALSRDVEEDWEVPREAAMKLAAEYSEILNGVKDGSISVSGLRGSSSTVQERPEAIKLWLDTVFFRRDLPVVIRAKNGRGKTYFLSWLLLRAKIMRPDGDFLTNIPWFWETDERVRPLAMPNFYNINRMSEMLRRSSETVLEGRVPYVIIDEMDNAVSSQDFAGGRGGPFASWKQFTYIKRHLKMKGPILAYHSVNDIPNYMRSRQVVADILKVYVHAGERYIFSEATRPYRLKITGTSLLYSKNGFNDFEIDVDMRKLRVSIGKTGTPAETARKILSNLDSCTFDAYEKRKEEFENEELYREICDLKKDGLKFREIKKLIHKTETYIQGALEWGVRNGLIDEKTAFPKKHKIQDKNSQNDDEDDEND